MRLSVVLILGLSAVAVPPSGEAQFLKKLSQGLDKVNKTLEKVEEAVKPDEKKSDKVSGQKSSPAKAQTQSSQQRSAAASYPVVETKYNHPFVTAQTRYMQVDNLYDDTVSDVYEGVFTVKQNFLFSFWTLDGECLFGSEWKLQSTVDFPRFDSGVAVAIHNTKKVGGKDVFSLLYLDGSVKQLDPNWTYVSQFHDGIALVEQTINYKKSYFFINPRGEKIFPSLVMTSKATVNPIRPLCDGLRAVYMKNGTSNNWGFIDAKGKIVIPANYNRVGDFHGGYCWVEEKVGSRDWILIDTKGREVYRTTETSPGQVGDNIFYLEKDGKTVYFDVSGRELSRQDNGNTFFGGHAFIGHNHTVSMVDTAFNVLRTYSTKVLNGVTTSQHGPWFGPYGLGSDHQRYGSIVLDSDGHIVLADWATKYGKESMGNFGIFQKSGFAKLDVKIDYKEYKGLMDATGRVEWLFGTGSTPSLENLPGEPEPIEPPIGGTPPPGPIPVDPRKPPVGPKTWTAHTFSVTVAKEGEGTVSVSQSSGIKYGDPVTFSATPAEHWAIADIETSPAGLNTMPGQPIPVTSDIRIKVRFVKEEEVDPVQTGVYQGILQIRPSKPGGLSDDIPVYAELSREEEIESPYGQKTSGFLVLMFDPKKRYVGSDFETYIFCAPLKVAGTQTDADGRNWLVVEGGNVTFGNLKVNPSDPLMALYINMAMAFDGHSSPDCIPRRYRIEMLDRDDDKDEFTFGEMQTYSTKSGKWVDSRSKEIRKETKGLIVTKVDKGLPTDLVKDVRMKPARKRTDVSWYPPLVWYDGNESSLRHAVEQMGNAYRSFKSDYDTLFDK